MIIAGLKFDYTTADDEDEEMDDEAALDKFSNSASDLQRVKKKKKLTKDHEVKPKDTKQTTRQNEEIQTLHTDKNNILNWQ